MRLNVGCGTDPWGDVRLDIRKEYLGRKSTLNVVGDAEYLPFRDDIFEEVRVHHVLEHMVNWKKALRECMLSRKIQIKIPKDTYFVVTFLLELADMIIKISDKQITKKYDLTAPQGVGGRNADLTLIRNKIGWEPKVTLEEELEKTYKWIETKVNEDRKTLTINTNQD